MPRPQVETRKNTTIGSVPKGLVLRIRRYAKKDPERKGNESTAAILERIVSQYEAEHTAPNLEAQPTYPQ